MDISQYSIVTLASVVAALSIQSGMNVGLAIVLMLLVSAAAGAVNSVFVALLKIPAVITTMGTMQIFR